jgi:hypothetical protein
LSTLSISSFQLWSAFSARQHWVFNLSHFTFFFLFSCHHQLFIYNHVYYFTSIIWKKKIRW